MVTWPWTKINPRKERASDFWVVWRKRNIWKVHYIKLAFRIMPSVLWRCWLGGRKGIRPVKTEWWGTGVVICLELGAKWFAYGPADATATPSSLAPVKFRMVYLSGAGLHRLSWNNKSSAVAEMGDRGHNRHGYKTGGCCAPFASAGNPSNTMWPARRSPSVPSGIFIHPAVWPQ